MGSFFSTPTSPAPPPLPTIADPEVKEREQRLEALERRRRGRDGLITTSARGLLAEGNQDAAQPKTLLGD